MGWSSTRWHGKKRSVLRCEIDFKFQKLVPLHPRPRIIDSSKPRCSLQKSLAHPLTGYQPRRTTKPGRKPTRYRTNSNNQSIARCIYSSDPSNSKILREAVDWRKLLKDNKRKKLTLPRQDLQWNMDEFRKITSIRLYNSSAKFFSKPARFPRCWKKAITNQSSVDASAKKKKGEKIEREGWWHGGTGVESNIYRWRSLLLRRLRKTSEARSRLLSAADHEIRRFLPTGKKKRLENCPSCRAQLSHPVEKTGTLCSIGQITFELFNLRLFALRCRSIDQDSMGGQENGLGAALEIRRLEFKSFTTGGRSGNYCGKTETSHQFRFLFAPRFPAFCGETRGEKFVKQASKQRWRER